MDSLRSEGVADSRHRRFATTRWSLVLQAGGESSDQSRLALEELCVNYWYPLYAFVRRNGHQPAEAQDVTQAFFAFLFEKDTLRRADKERGRFRTFLLASMRNFLANWRRHQNAERRGGTCVILSLDFDDGERRFQNEPADQLSPERNYERRWAMQLLTRAIGRLEKEQQAQGKQEQFHALKVFLGGTEKASPYRRVAEELGMSENAVKVAVHRLRRRCRELLRDEIAHTVTHEDEIDDEIRLLFEAVRSSGNPVKR